MSTRPAWKTLLATALLGLAIQQSAVAQWRGHDADDDDDDNRRLPRDKDSVSMPDRAKDYASAMQLFKNQQEDRNRVWAQIQSLRNKLEQEMQASPERQRARAGVSETREAYYTERDRVIGKLRGEADYRDAKEKSSQIDARIQKLHAEKEEDNRLVIRDLASERMRWGDRITTMEERALDKAGVEQLRDAWIAAQRALDKVTKEQEARIEKDPAIVALAGKLEDLRGDLNTTRVQLAGAQAAYFQAQADVEENDDYRRRYYYLYYPYRDIYRITTPYFYPTRFHSGYPGFSGTGAFYPFR